MSQIVTRNSPKKREKKPVQRAPSLAKSSCANEVASGRVLPSADCDGAGLDVLPLEAGSTMLASLSSSEMHKKASVRGDHRVRVPYEAKHQQAHSLETSRTNHCVRGKPRSRDDASLKKASFLLSTDEEPKHPHAQRTHTPAAERHRSPDRDFPEK